MTKTQHNYSTKIKIENKKNKNINKIYNSTSYHLYNTDAYKAAFILSKIP